MDTTHGEFWRAEERATVSLVESMETKTIERDYPYRTVDVPVWSIEWAPVAIDEDPRVERFPNRQEAMVRWVQLLAQNGASP